MDKTNILVVDDAPSIRKYLKEILAPLHASVTEAENGVQAYELIKEHEYDIILMDIVMPGVSGLDITKKVRVQLGYNFTPIIVITGLRNPELIQKAFNNGASDYITKPLQQEEVLARVKVQIENRRLNYKLRLAKISAENASYAKSEFISRLAHELKTPLNAISGYAQLIQMELNEDNEAIQENLGYIHRAAILQEELINEVINLSKIEAGIIDINLKQIELVDIIKETFGLTRHMAQEKNINLKLPRLESVRYTLTADDKRLKQVFLNLLSNAIKYNEPNGNVNLEIEKLSDDFIRIGIRDTGDGIDKEDFPKLFEAFNRLGAETKKIEGTGIGLPISKRLVELMGGKLIVESTKGLGSIFWIKIQGKKSIFGV